MFASVNTDRHGSGEWLPLYIAGRFIYIVVQLLLCGVVLFRAHADEHRGLFFTVVAAFFFYFLSTVGQASPYTWLEGPGGLLYLLALFVGIPVCILKIDKARTTGARAHAPRTLPLGQRETARLDHARAPLYRPLSPPRARAQRNAAESTRGSWRPGWPS